MSRRFRFILPDGQRDENAIERAAQRRLGHYAHQPEGYSWQRWRDEVMHQLEADIADEMEGFTDVTADHELRELAEEAAR